MEEPIIQLTHKEYLKVDRNYEKAAEVAKLVYVKDDAPGIQRVKKGDKFLYLYKDKPVKDEAQLARIKKLVIPPAWESVWICPLDNGHIQATGFDLRKRKQYRYHSLWNVLRNETKFHRLIEFGKRLPELRLKIENDFAKKEMSFDKVLATLLSVMERTYIRIGNNGYEKLYGSYGLTTLKDKHVAISGDSLQFTFKGKKGVEHKISVRNKKLAKAVKDCRDIPGKELFQYYDDEGKRRTIDSGAVNNYIQEATGYDFTTKDFRTWAGSVHALQAFRSVGDAATQTDKKKNVVAVLDEVSKKLGNTRTVCKKYYVHPGLVKLYEEDKLARYLKELDSIEEPDNKSGLTTAEQVLMRILKSQ